MSHRVVNALLTLPRVRKGDESGEFFAHMRTFVYFCNQAWHVISLSSLTETSFFICIMRLGTFCARSQAETCMATRYPRPCLWGGIARVKFCKKLATSLYRKRCCAKLQGELLRCIQISFIWRFPVSIGTSTLLSVVQVNTVLKVPHFLCSSIPLSAIICRLNHTNHNHNHNHNHKTYNHKIGVQWIQI